jgi:hypothetical protein
VIFRIGLAFHVHCVAGQQILQRRKRQLHRFLDLRGVYLAQVFDLQELLLFVELLLTLVALDVGHEPGHQLVHRDGDVESLLFLDHFVSKHFEILFERCTMK